MTRGGGLGRGFSPGIGGDMKVEFGGWGYSASITSSERCIALIVSSPMSYDVAFEDAMEQV